MNKLIINIDKRSFQPEDLIKGSIQWQLEKPPKDIVLQIGWQTEGRGTQDNQVEFEQVFTSQALSGMESFYYKLPTYPYSFIGKLIELKWFIIAYTKKSGIESSVEIVIAPNLEPVKL